jgi:hypothetical protein
MSLVKRIVLGIVCGWCKGFGTASGGAGTAVMTLAANAFASAGALRFFLEIALLEGHNAKGFESIILEIMVPGAISRIDSVHDLTIMSSSMHLSGGLLFVGSTIKGQTEGGQAGQRNATVQPTWPRHSRRDDENHNTTKYALAPVPQLLLHPHNHPESTLLQRREIHWLV